MSIGNVHGNGNSDAHDDSEAFTTTAPASTNVSIDGIHNVVAEVTNMSASSASAISNDIVCDNSKSGAVGTPAAGANKISAEGNDGPSTQHGENGTREAERGDDADDNR